MSINVGMNMQDENSKLTEFSFPIESSSPLRCRKCGEIIKKYYVASLLGTTVKYGYCRKSSHGASVCKA